MFFDSEQQFSLSLFSFRCGERECNWDRGERECVCVCVYVVQCVKNRRYTTMYLQSPHLLVSMSNLQRQTLAWVFWQSPGNTVNPSGRCLCPSNRNVQRDVSPLSPQKIVRLHCNLCFLSEQTISPPQGRLETSVDQYQAPVPRKHRCSMSHQSRRGWCDRCVLNSIHVTQYVTQSITQSVEYVTELRDSSFVNLHSPLLSLKLNMWCEFFYLLERSKDTSWDEQLVPLGKLQAALRCPELCRAWPRRRMNKLNLQEGVEFQLIAKLFIHSVVSALNDFFLVPQCQGDNYCQETTELCEKLY